MILYLTQQEKTYFLNTWSNLTIVRVHICKIATLTFIRFYVQNDSVTQQDHFHVSSKEKVNPLTFKISLSNGGVGSIWYMKKYKNCVVHSGFWIKILSLLQIAFF